MPKYNITNQHWYERQSDVVKASCVRVKALDSISECGFIPASRQGNGPQEPAIDRHGWMTIQMVKAYGKKVQVVEDDQKRYQELITPAKPIK